MREIWSKIIISLFLLRLLMTIMINVHYLQRTNWSIKVKSIDSQTTDKNKCRRKNASKKSWCRGTIFMLSAKLLWGSFRCACKRCYTCNTTSCMQYYFSIVSGLLIGWKGKNMYNYLRTYDWLEMGKLICRICKPSKVTMALNSKYLPQCPVNILYLVILMQFHVPIYIGIVLMLLTANDNYSRVNKKLLMEKRQTFKIHF